MKHLLPILLISTCTVLSLSACSDTREALGLTNTPPDEFAVVDHPPLSLPPDYALRPPRPGAPSRVAANPGEQAAKALYGAGSMQAVPQQGVSSLKMDGLSASEQALIAQSGSDKADPRIRSVLDREASGQVVGSRKLLDNILFWRDPKKPDNAVVVDAVAERKRIEAAKDAGQSVVTGGTQAIQKSKQVIVP